MTNLKNDFITKSVKITLISAVLFVVSGCTDPGQKTAIGAATGGVVGAGLGAIIGSQTGDAGTGLALGAVAGSAGGALIGNSIEARDEQALAQKKTINKHQRVLNQQRREIEQLREGSIAGDPSARASRFPDPNQSLSFKYRRAPASGYKTESPSSISSARFGRDSYGSASPSTMVRGQERNVSQQVDRSSISSRDISIPSSRIEPRADSGLQARSAALTRESSIASDSAVAPVRANAERIARNAEVVPSAKLSAPVVERSTREVEVEDSVETQPVAKSQQAPKAALFEDQVKEEAAVEEKREIVTSGAVVERELPVAKIAQPSEGIPSAPVELEEPMAIDAPKEESVPARIAQPAPALSESCKSAQEEVSRASASKEHADKLFFYRRALRLCPEDASIHNGLGEIYKALNRNVDAEFEFREALRLDPSLAVAQENLSKIK